MILIWISTTRYFRAESHLSGWLLRGKESVAQNIARRRQACLRWPPCNASARHHSHLAVSLVQTACLSWLAMSWLGTFFIIQFSPPLRHRSRFYDRIPQGAGRFRQRDA